jgi:hypothetical protein
MLDSGQKNLIRKKLFSGKFLHRFLKMIERDRRSAVAAPASDMRRLVSLSQIAAVFA